MAGSQCNPPNKNRKKSMENSTRHPKRTIKIISILINEAVTWFYNYDPNTNHEHKKKCK